MLLVLKSMALTSAGCLILCSWEQDLVLELKEESLFLSEHPSVLCKITMEINLAFPHIFHQNKVQMDQRCKSEKSKVMKY